ncbi:MAG TPA: Uma2 family endonuclease [Chloroflexota bacterium]|nr:Uma2 family endonuclease [Chloroflexota bacterium]
MAVQLKRWSRQEYDKMIDAGVFAEDERVELLEGEIVQVAAQHAGHATGAQAAEEALRLAYGTGFTIRTQLPLIVGPDSEPEPDVAVVRGHWRQFRTAHPSSALLVVEISDSSLDVDRHRRGRIYARAGIPEYWIVNLIDRVVEVYRDPRPDAGYGTRLVLGAALTITPLTVPSATIAVLDLLP